MLIVYHHLSMNVNLWLLIECFYFIHFLVAINFANDEDGLRMNSKLESATFRNSTLDRSYHHWEGRGCPSLPPTPLAWTIISLSRTVSSAHAILSISKLCKMCETWSCLTLSVIQHEFPNILIYYTIFDLYWKV